MKPSKHETTHEEKELIGQTSIFETVAIDRIVVEQEPSPIEEPADVDPVQLPTMPEVSPSDLGSLEPPACETDQSEKQSEIALVLTTQLAARVLSADIGPRLSELHRLNLARKTEAIRQGKIVWVAI